MLVQNMILAVEDGPKTDSSSMFASIHCDRHSAVCGFKLTPEVYKPYGTHDY